MVASDPLRTLGRTPHNHPMKRTLFLSALVLGSAAYWAAWLGVTAVAIWIHGDCGAGTTEAELAVCVTEKRWVFWAFIAFGAALWVAAVVGLSKERWPKG